MGSTMTDKKEAQPEALRLAAEFEDCTRIDAIPSINDVKKSAAELRRQHAEIQQLKAQLADETESASEWRRLALQFDGHRMQALSHLRLLTKHPGDHCAAAVNFLAAPPLSGEQVLADRLAQLSARQAAPDGWRLVPVEPTEEMLDAAHEGDREYTLRVFGDVMTVMQGPHDHYVAMLSAAPPAPGQPQCSRTGISEQACPTHPRNLPDR